MKLELYMKEVCPYCQKVISFIENNNLEDQIEYKDIVKDPDNLDYLVKNSGKNMVPCLFVDGKPMYESDDIVDWLDENLVK